MRKTVNRKLIFGIIIAAIAIASILVTFFICVAFMRAGVGDEVDRHLSDVAEQNANAVNKKNRRKLRASSQRRKRTCRI